MARILLAKARFGEKDVDGITPPLGVMYIASVLREAGHVVSIFDPLDGWDRPEGFRRALVGFAPDVIGISAISLEAGVMDGMAALGRAMLPDVPIIVGGSHPAAYPELCARHPAIDFVVLGEGERTAVELVDALTRGHHDPREVPGVCYLDDEDGEVRYSAERAAIQDLDALPFPAWDLIDVPRYGELRSMAGVGKRPYMALFTSRGCPFKCIYCHDVHGKRFRSRSAEHVVEEMRILRRRYGIRDFEIVDDIFNFDRRRMLAILDSLIASELSPTLHFPNALRTDLLDRDQIRALKAAGTCTLCVAVETTSARLQKLSKKHLRVSRVADNAELAVREGLYVRGFFMLGFPTETLAEARDTVEYAIGSRMHEAFFHLVTPFAGTTLYEMYREELRRRGQTVEDFQQMDFLQGRSNLSAMSDEELFSLQREAFRRFYLDPRRALRILRRYPSRRELVRLGGRALFYAARRTRPRREDPAEAYWRHAGLTGRDDPALRRRPACVRPRARAGRVARAPRLPVVS